MRQSESQSIVQKEVRPLANFPPSIWRNYFDTFAVNDMEEETYTKKVDNLKEDLKDLLMTLRNNLLESIKFIDLLSHLGVSYHFEKEIEEQLEDFYINYTLTAYKIDDDLNTVALIFRVFRENGYYMNSDVFSKFIDNDGKIKDEVSQDLKAMLSLYEAAHLRVHGEDILEEALEFTTIHLKSLSTQSSHPLAKHIEHCLDYPIRKSIPRVEARYFISIYEEDECHNKTLLEFSKADFNLVQLLHRQELSQITNWHKELAAKLTYARDRVAEVYFWMMAIYFEPHFSRARIIATKIVLIYSYLDDTYDSYATQEEIEKLTNAIKRWNINNVDDLPGYMKFLYKSLLDLYHELDQEMSKEGRSYAVDNAKKHVTRLVCAYAQEAKWCNDDHVPKFDDYMENARKSAIIPMFAASIVGMGEVAGREAIEWLNSYPKIMKTADTIARLMDDIKSYKFEQERKHMASAVECYMKDYGVKEEEALEAINKIVDDAWRDINKECMKPTAISIHILLRVLNFCRSCVLIYKHTDGYTNPEALRETIASLYVNNIPI